MGEFKHWIDEALQGNPHLNRRNFAEESNDFWKKELKKCSLDTTRVYMIEKYVFTYR